MDYKKKINLSQAEDITGLNRKQLKNLIKTGKVIGYRVGYKTYLIDVQSMEEYIVSREIKPITGGSVVHRQA